MMTITQKAVLDRYFVDMENVQDTFQLYTAEDSIRGALKFMLDTQAIDYNEYEAWDEKLRRAVYQTEKKKGF